MTCGLVLPAELHGDPRNKLRYVFAGDSEAEMPDLGSPAKLWAAPLVSFQCFPFKGCLNVLMFSDVIQSQSDVVWLQAVKAVTAWPAK